MEIAETDGTTWWNGLRATGVPTRRLHSGWRGATTAPLACAMGGAKSPLNSDCVGEKGNQLHDKKLDEDGGEGCQTAQKECGEGGLE